jgi:hypothetical protein
MNIEFGLEPFEDTRDERAHQIIIAHLAQASPAEQFCFVQRSNYDGNARALRWLADRPETDRAAILATYWNLGADWLMQFAAGADVPDYERQADPGLSSPKQPKETIRKEKTNGQDT